MMALEEITAADMEIYEGRVRRASIRTRSPGHGRAVEKYPLAESKSVDIGMGGRGRCGPRCRRPQGKVAVYVAHLASVRVGSSGFTSGQRDDTIKDLGRQIADEKLARVIVMGDFNGTANDRSLAPLTSGLRSAQGAAG